MSDRWKSRYSAADTETVSCALCGSSSSELLAREWSLGIVQCTQCELVYVSPRVRDPDKNYWGDEAATEGKYEPIFAGLRRHDRDRNYLEHWNTIRQFKPDGRVLDVGTHCGFFLRMARGLAWDIQGIEPSPANAELARRKFGLNVTTGYLRHDTFAPESFDIVTMVDVFEHVTDPLNVLDSVRRVLKPDGILFLKVPNAAWNLLKHRVLVRTLQLKGFDIFDAREHVVHYSQKTLAKMLQATGFRPLAFYVPRPIQTGRRWKKAGRWMAQQLARAQFGATGTLGPLATDVACVAEKVA